MPYIAGYKGRLTIAGMNLKLNRWSVDWSGGSIDVSSLESKGQEGFVGGVKELTITFDAFYDTTDNPYQDPVGLEPGLYYAIVIQLDKNTPETFTWNIPTVLCLSAHNEASPRDVPRYTFTGKLSEYDGSIPRTLNATFPI